MLNPDRMKAAGRRIPNLITPLPGPKAAALIAEDRKVTSPSYTRAYPLVAARGEGAVIEDVDGNQFLDCTAGIAVCSTGHCHPRIVAAIQKQSGLLLHMSGTDFYYEPQIRLAQKLAALAPGTSEKRVFFTNSGAESIEAAIKLARYHTGRQQIIAFFGAFHGRTMGALSLTASKAIQRKGFAPLVPGVHHMTFPNCYRCPRRSAAGGCCFDCFDELDNLFRRNVPPEEVAAIVVEPVQGEGGYIVPPAEFHQRLRDITSRHGILYVVDEVQSGMGRTGKMFGIEHWGVEPDVICLAKGIASGLPLGAMIARGEIMNWPPGAHASTFGGNPVACVAALETIALLEEELLSHTVEMGTLLKNLLRDLQDRHELIGEVRGLGLMVGAELVRDRATQERAVEERNAVVAAAFRRGLLLLGCGESAIRFCPPLVIDEEQIRTAVRIFEEALIETANARN